MSPSAPRAVLPGAASVLTAFAGKKVLVVGDLVADEYIYGEADRISREAPVLIVRQESSEVDLGGAGNAAANLAALGAKVTLLGLVGRDELGRSLRAKLRRSRIELVSPSAPGFKTESKTRIMAGGLNTRRQQVVRLDCATAGTLPPAVIEALAGEAFALAAEADAVLVSDYGGSVLAPPVIAALVACARERPVCVDSRYNLAAFAGATVLKPNEPEFEALTGVRAVGDKAFVSAITLARRKCGGSSLVITRGRHGMAVVEKGRIEQIPPHGNHEAVDVTGAGDTVGATLTLALAAGLPLIQAARIANVAGGVKVRKIGTVPVGADELARELDDVR